MDPEYVRRRLRVQADDVHRSLLLEYGQTPERERTVETTGRFPETVEDLFPWATVTVLTDPDRERALLIASDGDHDWEPPGARGDPSEAAETTARRGAAEATGADPRVVDLLLLERLELDYGREDGLTAPLVQAVFHAVVDPEVVRATGPQAGTEETRWLRAAALDESVRFREAVARALGDGR